MIQPPAERSRAGVIALVPELWGWRWSTRHQVLTRLAQRFPVVWVNPPHEWQGTFRRLRAGSAVVKPLADQSQFFVYRPEAWLPTLYRSEWLAQTMMRKRLERARDILRANGCDTIILSIWHPKFVDAARLGIHDFSVYHIDDEYSFSEVELPMDPAEQWLLENADQVFVHSDALLQSKGPYARHIALTPNGVDCQAFAMPGTEPTDLASIPHPRVGYTGFVKKQINWELFYTLAQQHPEWSFVIVGKRRPHEEIADVMTRLESLRNVYFLGEKPTSELTRYPQYFDVCVMPYRVNDYTKYINPLKLNEYLAAGRPCIGPPIPALQSASGVTLADTPEEWSHAIQQALEPAENTSERVAERREAARRFDWDGIVGTLADTLQTRLAERK